MNATPNTTQLARAAIEARDRYGWSPEADEALNALRAALASQPAQADVSLINEGNKPAQAETVGEVVATLHDDGYWTPAKTEAGRALNERLMRAGTRVEVCLPHAAPPQAQPAPVAVDEREAFDQWFERLVQEADEEPCKWTASLAWRAALQSARSGQDGGDAGGEVWTLDDEGRAMIVNSHHYTAESIRAIVEQLKTFADPTKTTQADWDSLDWRGFCNVLWRIITGLAHEVVPAAVSAPAATAQGAGQAVGDERLLNWAVARWNDEVAHRPLVNKNRRPLDDAWRQVIRFAGGDPDALVGPSHDALTANKEQR